MFKSDPPFLVAVFSAPGNFKTATFYSYEELNKVREILDRNELYYTIAAANGQFISSQETREIQDLSNNPGVGEPSQTTI